MNRSLCPFEDFTFTSTSRPASSEGVGDLDRDRDLDLVRDEKFLDTSLRTPSVEKWTTEISMLSESALGASPGIRLETERDVPPSIKLRSLQNFLQRGGMITLALHTMRDTQP